MKKGGGKKAKPRLYSHIASAIIPSAGIIAVPSVANSFPRQKSKASEQWGPLATSLLRASSMNQLIIPSSSSSVGSQLDDDYVHAKKKNVQEQVDTTTDDEITDDENVKPLEHRSNNAALKSNQSNSLSDAERRLFGQRIPHDESIYTENDTGVNSTAHMNPKQALTTELSRSMDDKLSQHSSVVTTRQQHMTATVNPIHSQSGPTIAKTDSDIDVDNQIKPTTRSSLNDTTTLVPSARSVSFKDPVLNKDDYASISSAKLQEYRAMLASTSSPEEYQRDVHDLERYNELLNDEVQQLRSSNQTLQKQHGELLNRLQTSQILPQELTDVLKQYGRDQTKDLENRTKILQDRCDQLQNELSSLRERYAQSQNQTNLRELKNENHFLKDYIHRLNAATSEYQAMYPPKTLKKEINKDQNKLQGLPTKGPSPIWLLNQKFLAPLFVCYDEKLRENKEFINKLQAQLNELNDQVKLITHENISLLERLSRSTVAPGHDASHLSDIEHIKRQAYLVLEENKVLEEQVDLQTNRLNDIQKSQIQEVSNLTRRLIIVESEKTESDRLLEMIRFRNDELKRKYEQLMLDSNHRIPVQEHVHEISEMKRLTDELSEKHAHEMEIVLRRVHDAELTKKTLQLKLTENRTDVERLKGEMIALKKVNKKLQLRVQTYEKKLELQQIKEQRAAVMSSKTNDELEQTRLERDTYLAMAKAKEDELNKIQAKVKSDADKLIELEERLDSYKARNKERISEAQDQTKKQHENMKIQCLRQEQRNGQLEHLLTEKQILIDQLSSEKRKLEIELETIWQTTNAESLRIREQLLSMRVMS